MNKLGDKSLNSNERDALNVAHASSNAPSSIITKETQNITDKSKIDERYVNK